MEHSEKTVKLSSFLKVVQQSWILILVVGILCASAAFVYTSFFKTQEYQSSMRLMVYNTNWGEKATYSTSDISASSAIVEASITAIKEGMVISQVTQLLNDNFEKNGIAPITEKQVKSMVSASSDESMYMTIYARSESPNLSKLVIQAYETLMPDIINGIFPASTIKITTSATAGTPISKTVIPTSLLAFLAGAALSFTVALMFDMMDTTIKSEDDFRQKFQIPLLGSIPDCESTSANKKGAYTYGSRR